MRAASEQLESHEARWRRVSLGGFVVGAVALVVVIVMAFLDRRGAAEGWLVAVTFWWTISLGALLVLGLHHLTGGAWAAAIDGELESAVLALGVVALAFIPILFTLNTLYEWATDAGHANLPHNRGVWLSSGAFRLRTIIYFACWGVFAWALLGRARDEHVESAAMPGYRRPARAAAGLIVLVLTGSLAAVDWLMSLDAHWYSTGFGLYVLAGCGLAGYATSIAVIGLDPGGVRIMHASPQQLRRDQGNFLLVFVIFWSYIAFMQYLIIWSGNLEEDVHWYAVRTHGFWRIVGLGLIILHFAVPFLVLLSDGVKESPRALGRVAAALVALHLIEVLWIIAPSLPREGEWAIQWLDLVAVAALGGLWVGVFALGMRSRPRVGLEFHPRSAPPLEPSPS